MSNAIPHFNTDFLSDWRAVRSMDDAALIREAQRGSSLAFDDLVRRYDQAILRLAIRLTGSDADGQDIYQEAFIKAYKNIRSFRSESSFYTWMHRIVCNLCMDRLRSKKFRAWKEERSGGVDENYLQSLPDRTYHGQPESQVLRTELQRHIQSALKRLTPRERIVFELRHFEGMKLRTVGEVLHTSEETAKNTLFRATHKVRNFLAHVRRPAMYQMRRSGSIAWSR